MKNTCCQLQHGLPSYIYKPMSKNNKASSEKNHDNPSITVKFRNFILVQNIPNKTIIVTGIG